MPRGLAHGRMRQGSPNRNPFSRRTSSRASLRTLCPERQSIRLRTRRLAPSRRRSHRQALTSPLADLVTFDTAHCESDDQKSSTRGGSRQGRLSGEKKYQKTETTWLPWCTSNLK